MMKLKKVNIKEFIHDHITHSTESNFILALSLGYGVFCGIMPMWGFQTVFTFATAHFFRLNKYFALLSSNISLPPVLPFIVYASYWTGSRLLGGLSESYLVKFLFGSVVLAVISGAVMTLVSWGILSLIRKPAIKNG